MTTRNVLTHMPLFTEYLHKLGTVVKTKIVSYFLND